MKILIGRYFLTIYKFDITESIGEFEAILNAQNEIINRARRDFGANFDISLMKIEIIEEKPPKVKKAKKKATKKKK